MHERLRVFMHLDAAKYEAVALSFYISSIPLILGSTIWATVSSTVATIVLATFSALINVENARNCPCHNLDIY
jgi:hypothetical protein